jgi:iron(III) transport system permease protein
VATATKNRIPTKPPRGGTSRDGTPLAGASRGRPPRIPPLLYLPPLLVGLAMILPLSYLVIRALSADPAELIAMVWRERTWILLRNTLHLTGGVLALTTVIALPLAWLVVRTDLPARKLVAVLAVMPLAVPGYVMAHALLSLGGANGIAAALGVSMARPTGFQGATLALSLYSFPYLFLNVRSALLTLDPGTEESARSLGLRPAAVAVRVVLPMIAPGILAGWLIISLYTLGDFGAVALMRYEVFSFAIYTQYSGAFDRVYAAALALLLLALTAVPLYLETRLLKHHNLSRIGSGVARRTAIIPLGRWKAAAVVFVVLIVVASLGLPLFTLLYWLTRQTPWDQLTRVGTVFMNSVSIALPAALVAVVTALPIAYLRVRYPSRRTALAERTAYIGYAVPPLALALALVFFSLRIVPALYQSLPLVVFAYSMNFLALAMGPIRSSLVLAPRRLEEAARSLGRGPVPAFLLTVLPVLREGLVASITLVFVMAMKELPMAFLLAPTGFTTLSVAIFSRTSEALFAEAAPYAAALVLLSSMFVGLMLRYEGKELA